MPAVWGSLGLQVECHKTRGDSPTCELVNRKKTLAEETWILTGLEKRARFKRILRDFLAKGPPDFYRLGKLVGLLLLWP